MTRIVWGVGGGGKGDRQNINPMQQIASKAQCRHMKEVFLFFFFYSSIFFKISEAKAPLNLILQGGLYVLLVGPISLLKSAPATL